MARLFNMPPRSKRVAIFGSTGSIGRSALEVIEGSAGRLTVVALSAQSRLAELVEQARRHRPQWVIATDAKAAATFDWKGLPKGCELLTGPEALVQVAGESDVDVVLAAIVGSAGLESTWAALESKKTVALANKETLVMAGELIADLARKSGGQLLPVDSEHSALFQALKAGQPSEVARLILTASGGPFKHLSPAELQLVTVA
jgi:1-deoxy-D-xylulose-5-phosphate reductoisomerase